MKPATQNTAIQRRPKSGQQAQREYLSDSDDLLQAWLVRHRAKPATYETYGRAVSDFFGTDRVTLDMARSVSDEMVNNYIVGLTNKRTGAPVSAKTKAVRLSAIRGFYDWLKRKRLLVADDNPFAGDVHSVKINRGEAIGPLGIYKAIKRTALEAGLPDAVAVHTLRHTGATLALEGKADIRQVQTMLRHKNISTTMVYAHQRDKLADSAVDYIHI